ncbi:hypothetical protein B1R32_10273 [Abditibacterium utsteinense]|uniref:Two component regulator propeller n=1 Tax=Abditibacterium utsteinense TaxID=1960156 RepID=A0A2S8SW93_9BACT|nr:hypothetical protein [Abditibacterium utsteinense]PQV65066.1 hypothetical protein B1R32_10273 [Abditibacterium utsteinense]
MKLRFVLAGALVLGAVWSGRAQIAPIRIASTFAPSIEPKNDAVFTSTREVRALAPIPVANGIWAATAGGVLEFNGEKWMKWTRQNGLPSHEALQITSIMHRPIVRFPTSIAERAGAKWEIRSAPVAENSPLHFRWKKQEVRVALDGLHFGGKLFPIPPQSNGTHISAALNLGPTLLIALYGDGLWNFDGQKWTRAASVPANAREITALAHDGRNLWIGTRRDGIFRRDKIVPPQKQHWQQTLQPGEPFSHNIQNFAAFRGVLWASTLDDGLVFRSGTNWKHVSTPVLSSSAPRQMLVFQHQLYVRHGGGLVDSFDGQIWTKNALKTIPRKGIYALAGDNKTLFAAGWGGWSEWDGATWTPHFEIAELKGVPILGLLLDGDYLWIATQSRGLGCFNRQTKSFRWFDERDNLPDDWITTLAQSGGKIYAGTFVGGLARLDGEKWHVFEELKGQNVTALAESNGKLWAATRNGIWEIEGDKATKVEKSWLDGEVQALLSTKNGMWIGARTSLNWLKSTKNEEAR